MQIGNKIHCHSLSFFPLFPTRTAVMTHRLGWESSSSHVLVLSAGQRELSGKLMYHASFSVHGSNYKILQYSRSIISLWKSMYYLFKTNVQEKKEEYLYIYIHLSNAY